VLEDLEVEGVEFLHGRCPGCGVAARRPPTTRSGRAAGSLAS
jgi:hypothetical protein